MRIIAGKVKGHHLKSPRTSQVRPTSDLIRETIFSILSSLIGEWPRVLDLYAGTGALGIEALSRGAQWCDFVEREDRLCALIRENLAKTSFADQAHVYCVSVNRALTFLRPEYTLILMDPPYTDPSVPKAVASVALSPLLGPGSVLVVEHSRRTTLEPAYDFVRLVKSRRHGDSCISVYRKEAGA